MRPASQHTWAIGNASAGIQQSGVLTMRTQPTNAGIPVMQCRAFQPTTHHTHTHAHKNPQTTADVTASSTLLAATRPNIAQNQPRSPSRTAAACTGEVESGWPSKAHVQLCKCQPAIAAESTVFTPHSTATTACCGRSIADNH